MLRKKLRYWTMCFVLGYIENGQKKFEKDSDMYNAYEKVILDVQGKYKYRWNSYFIYTNKIGILIKKLEVAAKEDLK